MKIQQAILKRTSYRGRYQDRSVSREDLMTIMKAGLAAPSGCNKQTTSLIAVDDPALLAEIKALIDPPIFQTAPAAIFVLTQAIPAYRDKCFNVQDYAAAIENMLLAVLGLGMESCWYEGHLTDDDHLGQKIAQRLGVPEGYELVCALPVGYPAEPVRRVAKKPFEERAWFNGFGKE
jgi:nitroreductase